MYFIICIFYFYNQKDKLAIKLAIAYCYSSGVKVSVTVGAGYPGGMPSSLYKFDISLFTYSGVGVGFVIVGGGFVFPVNIFKNISYYYYSLLPLPSPPPSPPFPLF